VTGWLLGRFSMRPRLGRSSFACPGRRGHRVSSSAGRSPSCWRSGGACWAAGFEAVTMIGTGRSAASTRSAAPSGPHLFAGRPV